MGFKNEGSRRACSSKGTTKRALAYGRFKCRVAQRVLLKGSNENARSKWAVKISGRPGRIFFYKGESEIALTQ